MPGTTIKISKEAFALLSKAEQTAIANRRLGKIAKKRFIAPGQIKLSLHARGFHNDARVK